MADPTPAEQLAAAEAAMAEAQANANAVRLVSAQAALTKLTSTAVANLVTALKDMCAESVDDLPRPAGQPGVEGTKQMLARVIAAIELGSSAAAQRVAALSPPAAPEAPAD